MSYHGAIKGPSDCGGLGGPWMEAGVTVGGLMGLCTMVAGGAMLVGIVFVVGLALNEHGSGSCRDAILGCPSVP